MKSIMKHSILFIIGGFIYALIEIISRGFTHWTMFILGGICFVCIGLINEFVKWEMPLWKQALIGGGIITSLEFVTGIIVYVILRWHVWDYSNVPFNVFGQICLPYMLLWCLISIPSIILDDYLRYWFFKEEKPHYNLF